MTQIFYKWTSQMKHACLCENEKTICFCNETYHAHVIFHVQLSTIELVIQNKQTEETEFYLHFEAKDFKTTKENLQAFFSYLDGQHPHAESITVKDKQIRRILISCTSGFTSAYFANLMQAMFDTKKQAITVDALPITELESQIDHYDYVLLVPQIAYLYPQLTQKYGKKILRITAMDFATGDVKHALSQLPS